MLYNESYYKEKIIGAIKTVKGDWFEEQTGLISDGLITSFDVLKLVNALEREFEIEIPLERIPFSRFNSVEEISEVVRELVK